MRSPIVAISLLILLALPSVTACSDTTAPSWPVGAALEAEPEAQSLRVTWPDPIDDDVLVFVVSVDGEERNRATTSTHTVTLNDLEDQTSYTIAVTAADAAGNVSAPLAITATTLDGTPPEWPDGAQLVAMSPDPADAEARSVDLGWSAAVDATTYRVSRDDAAAGITESTTHRIAEAPLGAETTFEVRAVDAAGNESEALRVVWGETEQARREAEAPVVAATERRATEGRARDERLMGVLAVLSGDASAFDNVFAGEVIGEGGIGAAGIAGSGGLGPRPEADSESERAGAAATD